MLATILICAGLAAVIAAIITRSIRNKRQGRSSCGCGCSSCPMSSSCHQETTETDKSSPQQ